MLTMADLAAQELQKLLTPYSIQVKSVPNNEDIPGSFGVIQKQD